jgi:hypothetical protein
MYEFFKTLVVNHRLMFGRHRNQFLLMRNNRGKKKVQVSKITKACARMFPISDFEPVGRFSRNTARTFSIAIHLNISLF